MSSYLNFNEQPSKKSLWRGGGGYRFTRFLRTAVMHFGGIALGGGGGALSLYQGFAAHVPGFYLCLLLAPTR